MKNIEGFKSPREQFMSHFLWAVLRRVEIAGDQESTYSYSPAVQANTPVGPIRVICLQNPDLSDWPQIERPCEILVDYSKLKPGHDRDKLVVSTALTIGAMDSFLASQGGGRVKRTRVSEFGWPTTIEITAKSLRSIIDAFNATMDMMPEHAYKQMKVPVESSPQVMDFSI